MENEPTVFVVDDDPAVRKALKLPIKSVGLNVESFASAREFLDAYDPARPGCLVVDVRMPGMDGLDLQEKLSALPGSIPMIFITGHGDIEMAVRAVQKGAVDFIEKPFRDQVLLDRIAEAIELDKDHRRRQARRAELASRLALLTPRERAVMNLVVAGKANKVIASELGLSRKTVEFHRAHVMEKMRADSVAELTQLAMAAGAAQAIS